MGTEARLQPVWRAYGIEVRRLLHRVAGVRFTSVAHSAALYIVDRRDERSGYLMPFSARLLADDIRALA
jgi:hypothetical protein